MGIPWLWVIGLVRINGRNASVVVLRITRGNLAGLILRVSRRDGAGGILWIGRWHLSAGRFLGVGRRISGIQILRAGLIIGRGSLIRNRGDFRRFTVKRSALCRSGKIRSGPAAHRILRKRLGSF